MNIFNAILGEVVVLHDGVTGIVVANFELMLFTPGYEAGGWCDSEGGLLIDGSAEGLVRYPHDVLLKNAPFYKAQILE